MDNSMKRRRTLTEQRLLKENLWDSIAKLVFAGDIKRVNKSLDNDPEIVAATKKAHDALVHLQTVVDKWADERELSGTW